MKATRIFLACLGAELFPLFRWQPGRGMALTIMTALILKHWLYQYLPIPEPWAVLLHVSAMLTGLYLVVGLFGFARIQALMIPRWDTGRRWLSCVSGSDRNTLLKVEPVAAFILVAVAVLSVSTGEWGHASTGRGIDAFRQYTAASAVTTQGNVFYPFWFYLGLAPVNAWGEIVTAYGRRLPQWFHESALMWGMMLPFMAWMGFALHGKWCDWPASSEYREEQRTQQTQANPGTLTFTTVEEVR